VADVQRVLAAALACTTLALAQQPSSRASLAPIDVDGDGRAEVRRAEVVAERGEAGKPCVAVLVEGRLWRWEGPTRPMRFEESIAMPSLHDGLRRFAADVAADGFRVVLLAVDVHAGPPHQDGRTVLGLRRLLQRLHATTPLAGAVLVGHFPDALLVRTCNWRRNEVLSLPGRDGKAIAFDANTTNVRCVPEIVAHRCDLVLADLDGDWERVYVPGPATLRSAWAVYGDAVPDAGGACTALQVGELAVTDVFHVRDGAAIADGEAFTLWLDANDRDHECTAADRARGNPLALPDIAVSRIDARGVAWSPDAGALVLGDEAFELTPAPLPAAKPPQWEPSERGEVALLRDYFDRNHAFRTKPLPTAQRRPASIAHGLGSGIASLRAADPAWADFADTACDVHGEGADLLALRRWLQQPAVLRTLRAHSDPFGAVFAKTALEALTGALPAPWHWVKEGEQLVPGWRDHANGGRADFAFWRALLERDGRGAPFLLIHTGCEALSPPHSDRPYDDPRYGRFAHAESLLFFTGCLAIVGRAKVFYDEPRGLAAALGEGNTFGDAWRRYFAIESEAKDWNEVGGDIGRKRAYFWSIAGDWTLRLPKRP
jgi:hypothetical protein